MRCFLNIENNEKPGLFLNSSEIEFAYDIKAEFDFDMDIFLNELDNLK